jgi:uncharacterized protein YigE (DUF2233 family)
VKFDTGVSVLKVGCLIFFLSGHCNKSYSFAIAFRSGVPLLW